MKSWDFCKRSGEQTSGLFDDAGCSRVQPRPGSAAPPPSPSGHNGLGARSIDESDELLFSVTRTMFLSQPQSWGTCLQQGEQGSKGNKETLRTRIAGCYAGCICGVYISDKNIFELTGVQGLQSGSTQTTNIDLGDGQSKWRQIPNLYTNQRGPRIM